MPSSPEEVWPLVSDTHAFNRAAGMGPWTFIETPDPLGGAHREGFYSILGLRIAWEERPFRWVEGREFSVLRVYRNGPFKNVLSHLRLEPAPQGCLLTYTIEAQPRATLWRWVAMAYLGVHVRRRFYRVFRGVARHLAGAGPNPYSHDDPQGRPVVARSRLQAASASLAHSGLGEALAGRLAEYVGEAPGDECSRIRPYRLADVWEEDREKVLRLCLHATRSGMLELTWDLMCPLCRGAKARVSSLAGLPSRTHCSSCNIEFDANFDRAVEVTFRPAQQVRPLELRSYCVGGPGNTPHVVLQHPLAPGEETESAVELVPGAYRVRGPRMAGTASLEVTPHAPGEPALTLECSTLGAEPPAARLARGEVRLRLRNPGTEEVLVIVERMSWPDDAVMAAQVSALQDFRDLFTSEVLAPGEQFQVRYLAFMFTDLRGSTALYRQRGDAPAFAMVRDHFRVVEDLVAGHGGAVVKTIGDAVMAVFVEPGRAVAAGLDVHDAFQPPPLGNSELVLKVGVHAGPCVAVTLNGRLDYFGTTVNTAVRLEGLSRGGDVLVLAGLLEDPAVQELVSSPGIRTEKLRAALKGFEGQADIRRITRDRGARA